MDKSGFSGSRIQLINGCFLLLSFIALRIIYGGFIVRTHPSPGSVPPASESDPKPTDPRSKSPLSSSGLCSKSVTRCRSPYHCITRAVTRFCNRSIGSGTSIVRRFPPSRISDDWVRMIAILKGFKKRMSGSEAKSEPQVSHRKLE